MINLIDVSKAYRQNGKMATVLQDLNFRLHPSEFVTLIGRSGSGKTTLLNLIMGLEKPSSGKIERAAGKPSISYVFQRPALLPWRTVQRNVSLPLEIAGVPKKRRLEMAQSALEKVGMDLASQLYPFQLSGGMAQRAAIARALAQDPELMLMDEPFSALDPILRDNLNVNLRKFHERTRKTILFVTHSINEATILSNRIAILEEGRILKEFVIDLPEPRGFHTFQSPEFLAQVQEIRGHLPIQPNLPRGAPS